jgi:hypothetical protein
VHGCGAALRPGPAVPATHTSPPRRWQRTGLRQLQESNVNLAHGALSASTSASGMG